MFRALRFGAVAIGGYLVISSAVNIVDESSSDTATATAQAAPDEGPVAAAATSTLVALSPPMPVASAPAVAEAEPVVTDVPVIGTIAELNVITGGPTSAAAGWSTVDGAEYALELIGPDGGQVQSFLTAATQWSMEGLLPGSAYLVRVRPIDPATGNAGAWLEQLFATQSEPATTTTTAPAPAFIPVPQPVAATVTPVAQYYANCSEAWAAGAAPLYRGDPGYRSKLDRDGDGVACE